MAKNIAENLNRLSSGWVSTSSACHYTVAQSSAVGRFLILLHVRHPGTRCQIISVIRRWAKTLLGDH